MKAFKLNRDGQHDYASDELDEFDRATYDHERDAAHYGANARSLLAEVRRLAADNARLRGLIKDTCDRNGTLRPYGIELCPWCRTSEASNTYHPPECPAFTEDGGVR